MKKQLTLFFLVILVTAAYLLLPRNQEWMNRIWGYAAHLPGQIVQQQEEKRMERRFGNNYRLSKIIASEYKKLNPGSQDFLLIPPDGYFKSHGLDYDVPEPAVFYYLTGIRTTYARSGLALQARWMVLADSGRIRILPVADSTMLRDSIGSFKNYGGWY